MNEQPLQLIYSENKAPHFFMQQNPNSDTPTTFPIDFQLFSHFTSDTNHSIFLKINNQVRKIIETNGFENNQRVYPNSIPIESINALQSKPFHSFSLNEASYNMYLVQHSQYENIYLGVTIASSGIYHQQKIALLIVLGSILLINILISIIYIMNLKRFTNGLSIITNAAKALSNIH